MKKELVNILVRNHTFNTIYIERYIWAHIPDYFPGLIGIQYFALIIINCVGECKVTELADMLERKESSVTKLLNKLESVGLICRRASSGDRRVTYVSLTKECAEVIERCHTEGARLITESRNGLDDEDCIELAKHIIAINEIFERKDRLGPLYMMKQKGITQNGVADAHETIKSAQITLIETAKADVDIDFNNGGQPS